MRIAVVGALGRMGSGIVRTSLDMGYEVVAAFESPSRQEIGKNLKELLGVGDIPLSPSTDMREVLKESKADVLIDFSAPEATLSAVEACTSAGVDMVIGTTGFSDEQKAEIESKIKSSEIAAVISPNMATGVNVFFKIAQQIAQILGNGYDVEIVEMHHRFKKDAPSGTALRVAELIAQAMGRDLKEDAVFGRHGFTGERRREEIGIHALRGGDVVGEHTVIFAGNGERIELVHRASSRQAFINGALRAAEFVVKAEKGKVYTMFDVLGI